PHRDQSTNEAKVGVDVDGNHTISGLMNLCPRYFLNTEGRFTPYSVVVDRQNIFAGCNPRDDPGDDDGCGNPQQPRMGRRAGLVSRCPKQNDGQHNSEDNKQLAGEILTKLMFSVRGTRSSHKDSLVETQIS